MMCFLISQMTLLIFEYYEEDNQNHGAIYALLQILSVVNCFWWSSIVVVQAYEWNLIASLVRYQRKYNLDVMGVVRGKYLEEEEP